MTLAFWHNSKKNSYHRHDSQIMLHVFLSSRARSWYFSHFSFSFISRSPGVSTSMTWYFPFLFRIIPSTLLFESRFQTECRNHNVSQTCKFNVYPKCESQTCQKFLQVTTYRNDHEKVVLLSHCL